MVDRIIKIREAAGLSQEEFADKLELSRNFINQVENGKKNCSKRTISAICEKISINNRPINKEWLLTGKGEMVKSLTKSQEIGDFVSSVMHLPDEDFKKRFISALQRLDEKDWKHLEEIATKLLKEKED